MKATITVEVANLRGRSAESALSNALFDASWRILEKQLRAGKELEMELRDGAKVRVEMQEKGRA